MQFEPLVERRSFGESRAEAEGHDGSVLERAEQQLVVLADEAFEPRLVVEVAGCEFEHERSQPIGDPGEGDERPPSQARPHPTEQVVGKQAAQGLGDVRTGALLGLPDQVADVELALGKDSCQVVECAHLPFPSMARSSRSRRSRSSRFSCSSWLSRARELRAGSCSHQSMPIDLAVSADAISSRSLSVSSSMPSKLTCTSHALTIPLPGTRSGRSAKDVPLGGTARAPSALMSPPVAAPDPSGCADIAVH